MPDVIVTLTSTELLTAVICGARRHLEALKKNLPNRHGADELNGWSLHIEGAAGEMAFAKLHGMFWSPTVNTFRLPDVGTLQVRTRSRQDYELIVRDGDSDDEIFALMTGQAPNFTFRGCIFGRRAKRDEWRQEHGGRAAAWFVPQSALVELAALHFDPPRLASHA